MVTTLSGVKPWSSFSITMATAHTVNEFFSFPFLTSSYSQRLHRTLNKDKNSQHVIQDSWLPSPMEYSEDLYTGHATCISLAITGVVTLCIISGLTEDIAGWAVEVF